MYEQRFKYIRTFVQFEKQNKNPAQIQKHDFFKKNYINFVMYV